MEKVLTARRNRLLAKLSKVVQERLKPHLRAIELKSGDVLYEVHGEIEFAYFPTIGTLSAVVVMRGGAMIEVATIGNEGGVGLLTVDSETRSPHRVFCQVFGEALRIDANILETKAAKEPEIRKALNAYQAAFMFQVTQSAACNGLHLIQQRCARWLLMTLDRVPGNEIELTHEILAIRLGVRRPGVSGILAGFQNEGLIAYHRGKIVVLDRSGLEAVSCECYHAIRTEYDLLRR